MDDGRCLLDVIDDPDALTTFLTNKDELGLDNSDLEEFSRYQHNLGHYTTVLPNSSGISMAQETPSSVLMRLENISPPPTIQNDTVLDLMGDRPFTPTSHQPPGGQPIFNRPIIDLGFGEQEGGEIKEIFPELLGSTAPVSSTGDQSTIDDVTGKFLSNVEGTLTSSTAAIKGDSLGKDSLSSLFSFEDDYEKSGAAVPPNSVGGGNVQDVIQQSLLLSGVGDLAGSPVDQSEREANISETPAVQPPLERTPTPSQYNVRTTMPVQQNPTASRDLPVSSGTGTLQSQSIHGSTGNDGQKGGSKSNPQVAVVRPHTQVIGTQPQSQMIATQPVMGSQGQLVGSQFLQTPGKVVMSGQQTGRPITQTFLLNTKGPLNIQPKPGFAGTNVAKAQPQPQPQGIRIMLAPQSGNNLAAIGPNAAGGTIQLSQGQANPQGQQTVVLHNVQGTVQPASGSSVPVLQPVITIGATQGSFIFMTRPTTVLAPQQIQQLQTTGSGLTTIQVPSQAIGPVVQPGSITVNQQAAGKQALPVVQLVQSGVPGGKAIQTIQNITLPQGYVTGGQTIVIQNPQAPGSVIQVAPNQARIVQGSTAPSQQLAIVSQASATMPPAKMQITPQLIQPKVLASSQSQSKTSLVQPPTIFSNSSQMKQIQPIVNTKVANVQAMTQAQLSQPMQTATMIQTTSSGHQAMLKPLQSHAQSVSQPSSGKISTSCVKEVSQPQPVETFHHKLYGKISTGRPDTKPVPRSALQADGSNTQSTPDGEHSTPEQPTILQKVQPEPVSTGLQSSPQAGMSFLPSSSTGVMPLAPPQPVFVEQKSPPANTMVSASNINTKGLPAQTQSLPGNNGSVPSSVQHPQTVKNVPDQLMTTVGPPNQIATSVNQSEGLPAKLKIGGNQRKKQNMFGVQGSLPTNITQPISTNSYQAEFLKTVQAQSQVSRGLTGTSAPQNISSSAGSLTMPNTLSVQRSTPESSSKFLSNQSTFSAQEHHSKPGNVGGPVGGPVMPPQGLGNGNSGAAGQNPKLISALEVKAKQMKAQGMNVLPQSQPMVSALELNHMQATQSTGFNSPQVRPNQPMVSALELKTAGQMPSQGLDIGAPSNIPNQPMVSALELQLQRQNQSMGMGSDNASGLKPALQIPQQPTSMQPQAVSSRPLPSQHSMQAGPPVQQAPSEIRPQLLQAFDFIKRAQAAHASGPAGEAAQKHYTKQFHDLLQKNPDLMKQIQLLKQKQQAAKQQMLLKQQQMGMSMPASTFKQAAQAVIRNQQQLRQQQGSLSASAGQAQLIASSILETAQGQNMAGRSDLIRTSSSSVPINTQQFPPPGSISANVSAVQGIPTVSSTSGNFQAAQQFSHMMNPSYTPPNVNIQTAGQLGKQSIPTVHQTQRQQQQLPVMKQSPSPSQSFSPPPNVSLAPPPNVSLVPPPKQVPLGKAPTIKQEKDVFAFEDDDADPPKLETKMSLKLPASRSASGTIHHQPCSQLPSPKGMKPGQTQGSLPGQGQGSLPGQGQGSLPGQGQGSLPGQGQDVNLASRRLQQLQQNQKGGTTSIPTQQLPQHKVGGKSSHQVSIQTQQNLQTVQGFIRQFQGIPQRTPKQEAMLQQLIGFQQKIVAQARTRLADPSGAGSASSKGMVMATAVSSTTVAPATTGVSSISGQTPSSQGALLSVPPQTSLSLAPPATTSTLSFQPSPSPPLLAPKPSPEAYPHPVAPPSVPMSGSGMTNMRPATAVIHHKASEPSQVQHSQTKAQPQSSPQPSQQAAFVSTTSTGPQAQPSGVPQQAQTGGIPPITGGNPPTQPSQATGTNPSPQLFATNIIQLVGKNLTPQQQQVLQKLQEQLKNMSPQQQQDFYRQQHAMIQKLQAANKNQPVSKAQGFSQIQPAQQPSTTTNTAVKPQTSPVRSAKASSRSKSKKEKSSKAAQLSPKGEKAKEKTVTKDVEIPITAPPPRIPTPPPSAADFIRDRKNIDKHCVENIQFKTPFASRTEAIKRLLPYHIAYEKLPDPDKFAATESDFEEISGHLLEKKQKMLDKFQMLLYKESMKQEPSSEMVMLERMFLQEERLNLQAERKRAEANQGLVDSLMPKIEMDSVQKTKSQEVLPSAESAQVKLESASGVLSVQKPSSSSLSRDETAMKTNHDRLQQSKTGIPPPNKGQTSTETKAGGRGSASDVDSITGHPPVTTSRYQSAIVPKYCSSDDEDGTPGDKHKSRSSKGGGIRLRLTKSLLLESNVKSKDEDSRERYTSESEDSVLMSPNGPKRRRSKLESLLSSDTIDEELLSPTLDHRTSDSDSVWGSGDQRTRLVSHPVAEMGLGMDLDPLTAAHGNDFEMGEEGSVDGVDLLQEQMDSAVNSILFLQRPGLGSIDMSLTQSLDDVFTGTDNSAAFNVDDYANSGFTEENSAIAGLETELTSMDDEDHDVEEAVRSILL